MHAEVRMHECAHLTVLGVRVAFVFAYVYGSDVDEGCDLGLRWLLMVVGKVMESVSCLGDVVVCNDVCYVGVGVDVFS